jgi:hypothetical protein
LPSAKTVVIAPFLSCDPSNPSSAALSSASVLHLAATSCAWPIASLSARTPSDSGIVLGFCAGELCMVWATGVRLASPASAFARPRIDGAVAAGTLRALAANRSIGCSPTASSAPASTSQRRAARADNFFPSVIVPDDRRERQAARACRLTRRTGASHKSFQAAIPGHDDG